MKKDSGWITSILMVLAALFGFSALPKAKAPETSVDMQTTGQSPSSGVTRADRRSVPDDLKKSPCWEIEKSVLIFIEKNGGDGKGAQPNNATSTKNSTDNQKTEVNQGSQGKNEGEPKNDRSPVPNDIAAGKAKDKDNDDGIAAAPSSCFDGKKQVTTGRIPGNRVRFIVATLPDPVHTHFSLLFDRLTEALQQAAQDQGYNYDSSWLPWTPEQKGSGGQKQTQCDDVCKAKQQTQPGVLVFRKAIPAKSDYSRPPWPPPPYDAGVIVFVVGENPTGGIDPEQLQNAFDWIGVLGGDVQQAGILGPYFSGSLPSLYEALLGGHIIENHAATPVAAPPTKTLSIFSGSVTSKAGIDWIDARLKNSRAQFFSFQQNDDNMIDNYCRYLRNQGYDTGHLAIVSEDETAYGFSQLSAAQAASSTSQQDETVLRGPPSLPHCETPKAPRGFIERSWDRIFHPEDSSKDVHGPLYVYYPRDIAALRSAYSQEQPSGTSKPQNTSTTGLPLDLVEPASRERDSITSFGERQTTLSQEATLFGLANLFKAHEIQFIVLRSSNTLDQVFLTRFFSQAYPSARVVLTSADLLFRRSDTAGFRGTMTLTTYPLLTWQQDWTHWQSPQTRHSHRAFPEETAEGLYLAARFLIDGGWSAENPPKPIPDASAKNNPLWLGNDRIKIQDYAPPSWLITSTAPADCPIAEDKVASTTRPPTWLSVVGSGQLWPIAVLGRCIPDPEGPRRYPGFIEHVDASGTPGDTLPWAKTDSKAEHPADLQLPITMFLCCAIVLGWSMWHSFCCFFGSHLSSIRFGEWKLSPSSFRSLAYFAPVPRRQHRWLIFIGCLLMWVIAVVIASALGVLHGPPYALQNPRRVGLYCIVLGILPFLALVANYRTFLPPTWSRDELPDSSSRGWQDRLQRALTVEWIWKTCSQAWDRLQRISMVVWIRKTLRRKPLPSKDIVASEAQTSRPGFDVPLMVVGFALMAIAAFAVFWIFHGWIVPCLGKGAAAFTSWRSMNPFSGVSIIVPLLLLTAGLYGWFWYSLSGLALFNAGVPKLPAREDLLPTMPMFSREGPGKRIQEAAAPLKGTFRRHFLFFAVAYSVFWWFAGDITSVRALGSIVFGKVYAVWFGLLIVITLTESWEMLRTWSELRQLLTYLDRMPLRRTLQALGGISWGTVWKISGNVLEQRYRLISRQIESLRHLENELERLRTTEPVRASKLAFGALRSGHKINRYPFEEINVPLLNNQLDECNASLVAFADWYAAKYMDCQYGYVKDRTYEADLSPAGDFQVKLASAAGVVLTRILLPAWRSETKSLVLESPPADKDKKFAPELPEDKVVKAAEEFFCLPYLGFIQNVLGRIRTMTLAIIWLFLGATLSVASYPFDPRPVISGIFVFVFLVVAAVMIFVYGQMHRDATLSHITNTNPGELGRISG